MMAIEIEHKFLVVSDAWRGQASKVVPMVQGYLNAQQAIVQGLARTSVRVRIEDDKGYLNIKSCELGVSRQEYEYPLPLADARALLGLCLGAVVEKFRHYVSYEGYVWEVDEFIGDNAGLVVAEIELGSVNEAFSCPPWVGKKVTGERRYYNLALVDYPYSQWLLEER